THIYMKILNNYLYRIPYNLQNQYINQNKSHTFLILDNPLMHISCIDSNYSSPYCMFVRVLKYIYQPPKCKSQSFCTLFHFEHAHKHIFLKSLNLVLHITGKTEDNRTYLNLLISIILIKLRSFKYFCNINVIHQYQIFYSSNERMIFDYQDELEICFIQNQNFQCHISQFKSIKKLLTRDYVNIESPFKPTSYNILYRKQINHSILLQYC
ncbi:unnamed protein product, partial (macronuclear) [Paramecium tetraurelia]